LLWSRLVVRLTIHLAVLRRGGLRTATTTLADSTPRLTFSNSSCILVVAAHISLLQ